MMGNDANDYDGDGHDRDYRGDNVVTNFSLNFVTSKYPEFRGSFRYP